MTALPKLEFGENRLPSMLQTEAAECGLVCLAMIAAYHGRRVDMHTLRSRFSLSIKGTTLSQLVRYADALNFSTRAVRLDIDELRELKAPSILHWNLNHFVVLKKADGKGIIIYDPAVGTRRLSYSEVSNCFTGVALELTTNTQFRKITEVRQVPLRALMGQVDGLWRSLGLVFVMALALELFSLVSPMFNQWVVDEALTSHDRALLNVLVIGFALLMIIQSSISLARGWTILYLSTHLNLHWVTNVFSHLIRLPMPWFEKRHLGDVVSRFGSIGTIQRTLTTGFIEVLLDGLMAFATLGMMLFYSTRLSMIVIAAVACYGLMRFVAYRPLREASEESLVLSAKEQSHFLETIRSVQAIKVFGQETDRRSRWLNLMVDSINRGIRTHKFLLVFGIANTAIFGLEALGVFWVGAGLVMESRFTVGMLFAFTSYGGQFSSRMAALIDKFFEFRMLSLHRERLADILLEAPEPTTQREVFPTNLQPRIELRDVSFRYADGEPWILRHINLTIEPGESLAIVGASGCGKTTLIKLILGLLTASEGEICYGDVPIQRLGHQAYRNVVAAVMQDDQLLTGSIAENISFFSPHADQARVEQCAMLAAIHDDIMAMPMTYHSLVGDMGTTLSGGQKQRVLLARALYKQPKILILDEATSHLDIEREDQVNLAIQDLHATRISVAHRPQTIAKAGRVVQLSAGKITADYLQQGMANSGRRSCSREE